MAIRFTQDIALQNTKISGLSNPVSGSDAANKSYVDALAAGLIWKEAARVATDGTTNVNLASPGATIDGVTLVDGDRVLLTGQSNREENGIYVFSGGALTRATDADDATKLRPGTAITVSEGAGQGNKTYVLITDGPITMESTPLDWTLANNNTAPVYTAGNGITVNSGTHTITFKATTGGGLSVGAGGASVQTGDGVTIDGSGGVAAVADPDGGLTVGAAGIAVVPDNGIQVSSTGVTVLGGYGVTINTDGVNVQAATNKGLLVDGNGVAVKLNTNGGIAVDANGLAVTPDPNGGLSVGAAGVALHPQTNKGLAVGASGASVVLDPNGGLSVGASGVAAVVDPNGGLYVGASGVGATAADGSVVVDSNGVAVAVGDGLVLDGSGVAIDTAAVARIYTALIGDGSLTTIDVAHGMNSYACGVEVFTNDGTRQTVMTEISRPDANTVRLDFAVAPATDEFQVVIWGFSTATV